MTRLVVGDEIDTPQRFNLIKLLGVILGQLGTGAAVWHVHRAEGYGLGINRLNAQLDVESSVRLEVHELAALLPGFAEWFYWLDAVSDDGTVRFGVVDSSYMFVDGPPAVIEAVVTCFRETREDG